MKNKKSPADMVSQLRNETPISFNVVQFVGVRIAFALIAAIIAVIVWAGSRSECDAAPAVFMQGVSGNSRYSRTSPEWRCAWSGLRRVKQ
jgi:hypothetical protein